MAYHVTVNRNGNYHLARWIDTDGTVRRKSLGHCSMMEACRRADELERQLNQTIGGTVRHATLGWLVDRFVQVRGQGTEQMAPATMATHARCHKLLLQHFGTERDIKSIGLGDMRDWEATLEGTGNTLRKRVKEAKVLFNLAVDEGLIEQNPAVKMKSTTMPGRPGDRRIVTRDEYDAVFEAMPDNYWRLALAMAYHAGLRRSEVFTATHRGWTRGHSLEVWSTKTNRSRTIRLEPELNQHIRDWWSGAKQIVDPECKYTQAYDILTRACTAAGVEPFNWQNLRQTRATLWRDAGYPGYAVNQWMGHTERVAEDCYLGDGKNESALAQALAELARLRQDNERLAALAG